MCKVLHIGNNNDHSNYSMNGSEHFKVNKGKHLGVTINNDLKPGKHCSEVAETADRSIGYTVRIFEFKSEKVIFTLFNVLMHLKLQYCIQFWLKY